MFGDEINMEFKTEKEIMEYLRNEIIIFRKRDAFDLLPHQVMSHGYMEWYGLLDKTFPSLSTDKASKIGFYHFCNVLFRGAKLTKDEQIYLRRVGWEQYLED